VAGILGFAIQETSRATIPSVKLAEPSGEDTTSRSREGLGHGDARPLSLGGHRLGGTRGALIVMFLTASFGMMMLLSFAPRIPEIGRFFGPQPGGGEPPVAQGPSTAPPVVPPTNARPPGTADAGELAPLGPLAGTPALTPPAENPPKHPHEPPSPPPDSPVQANAGTAVVVSSPEENPKEGGVAPPPDPTQHITKKENAETEPTPDPAPTKEEDPAPTKGGGGGGEVGNGG
jgi:hypothetical protein